MKILIKNNNPKSQISIDVFGIERCNKYSYIICLTTKKAEEIKTICRTLYIPYIQQIKNNFILIKIKSENIY